MTVGIRFRGVGRRRPALTPIGAVAGGIAAGAVGTLAMDALWFRRYKRERGESDFLAWELSSGLSSWDRAPVPALVAKRLVEGVFQRELAPGRAALLNNVTHWAYGALAGAQYGIVAGSLSAPRVLCGAPFGAAVWATGYGILPAAKLYKPVWQYDAVTLAKDLSAHLVYGLATAGSFQLVWRAARR
jgi:hypothetical protein